MLPEGFLKYISQYPQLSPLAADLLTAPPVSIRLNPAKGPIAPLSDQCIPWCDMGYYLPERPKFTFDPALHQGRYYVQDASSQAIIATIKQLATDQPMAYLDACAAPGGKTTCALSALPFGSLVLANEYDYKRAEILAENVAKWGNPNAVVSRSDTKKLSKLTESFDIVAVDAPCSGEGMMRKDQQAIDQWSESLVASCAATQREILANVWTALRPGGHLIYSTCTFNRDENEENLTWLVDEYGAEPVKIDALEAFPEIIHGIDTSHPCYRFLPGCVKGEGLFLCVVRKPGTVRTLSDAADTVKAKYTRKGKNSKIQVENKKAQQSTYSSALNWLKNPVEWVLMERDSIIYAQPRQWEVFIRIINNTLDVVMPGLPLAEIKGHDLIPTQQLALSTALNQSSFPTFEASLDQALTYLRRDSIAIDAPRGFVLLTYNDFPLGFVKNLGSRSNNLYPKHWRIRST